MCAILSKTNKLLLIGKTYPVYFPFSRLPLEYREIAIPCAETYFREDGECEILSQRIHAGPFSLRLHDALAKEDISVLAYTPDRIVMLHFIYEASVQAERSNTTSFILEERECNLFNVNPGLLRIRMENNTKILSVHINISPADLPALVAKYPALQCLLKSNLLTGTGAVNERPYHISPVCDLIIQRMLTCRYRGRNAYHFIYRCCLDLLLIYAAQESQVQQPFLFSSLFHQDVYRHMFRYLTEHPHKQHTLKELAFMYQLPVVELRQGFQQHFSMTIEGFMYMLKMQMTYSLLVKRDASMFDIALTAGFADVDDMIKHMEIYYSWKPKR
jgi:AraC-like DNA-binding protein